MTADALHCQIETAEIILARGDDDLLRLKANRPALHDMVQGYCAVPEILAELDQAQTMDADHGRLEIRRAWVINDLSWRTGPKTACCKPVLLPGLACPGMIDATATRGGKTTTSRHYRVSFRPPTAAARLVPARPHWSIENRLHWVLDMTFDEDRARTRKDHGPENLATLRKRALNLFKRTRPNISVRRKRKRSGWTDDFAQSTLGQLR